MLFLLIIISVFLHMSCLEKKVKSTNTLPLNKLNLKAVPNKYVENLKKPFSLHMLQKCSIYEYCRGVCHNKKLLLFSSYFFFKLEYFVVNSLGKFEMIRLILSYYKNEK